MPACAKQLFCLKAVLHTFSESTGLRVNYHKSFMVLINVSDEKMELLTQTLNCQKGNISFTYLGLPLGLTKPKVEDFFPLVQRVERRLSSCASYLSYGGRLTMINSVLSLLPTFYICSLKLPVCVIEQIDKYQRNCLWRRSESDNHGPALVAWNKVCKPKNPGGLGVLNLKVQNEAFLTKNLHKFFTYANFPGFT